MAKIRIGFSTHFEVENELVGIGTDNPTNTKQVLGNIQSSDAKVIGVSTLTIYQGFTDTKLSLQGSVGSKQHTTSGEIVIEGTVNVSSGTTFTSGPENLTATDNFTLPGISDDKPSVGTMRFNENLGSLEFYTGVDWRAVNSYVDMGSRGRGVFAGGYSGPADSVTNQIDYFDITTGGTAQEFGYLWITGASNMGGCSSATRGLFTSGYNGPTKNNIIEYINIASASNGTDFGDRTTATYGGNALSSSTRGVFIGGQANPSPSPGVVNIMDYVEIATIGNAVDFGDVGAARRYAATSSNGVRGFVLGGSTPSPTSSIDRITIASKGNTIDVGELTADTFNVNGCSNSTRSLIFLGEILPSPYAATKRTNAYEMASTGNAVDFGDLTVARSRNASCSSNIRGIAGGGSPAGLYMESILFSTKGSAEYFTDLHRDTSIDTSMIGVSDSHGGLGGF